MAPDDSTELDILNLLIGQDRVTFRALTETLQPLTSSSPEFLRAGATRVTRVPFYTYVYKMEVHASMACACVFFNTSIV
jgi:hypothetical protein